DLAGEGAVLAVQQGREGQRRHRRWIVAAAADALICELLPQCETPLIERRRPDDLGEHREDLIKILRKRIEAYGAVFIAEVRLDARGQIVEPLVQFDRTDSGYRTLAHLTAGSRREPGHIGRLREPAAGKVHLPADFRQLVIEVVVNGKPVRELPAIDLR